MEPVETKTKLLDVAEKLFAEKGVDATSLRNIISEAEVNLAAIHYHFPNKMDLIAALIDENHQVLKKATSEFMAYGGPARPQLEGLFAFTTNQCQCGRPICMIGVLAVDYEDLSDDIKDANDRFIKDSVKWLSKVLETGREREEFTFEGGAERKSISILAMIQGARQMARVHGMDILESMFEQIRTDLGIKA